MFAACGNGVQPQQSLAANAFGPPATELRTSSKINRDLTRSWIDPAAKGDLLYVSNLNNGTVYIYSWPRIRLVGKLTGFVETEGLCVDGSGHVWVVNEGQSDVLEYAHGGTKPIAVLNDPNEYPAGCAVDPTTGNLAVTNIGGFRQTAGNLVIYPGAKGTPKPYTDSSIYAYYFCGYDGKGNLYLDGRPHASSGFAFAELHAGKNVLKNVTLNQSIGAPGGVQWDGSHVAVGDQTAGVIYQFAIAKNIGTKVGSTPLDGSKDVVQFWIQSTNVIGPNAGASDVLIWNYPAGGMAKQTIYGQDLPVGAVVSKAQ